MAFGWCIFLPLWILGVRKVPKLNVSQAVTLAPAAVGHLATHVGAVVAFFAGAVSFGHIVKASEPVLSSALNFFFLGEVMPWQVYAALLPVIGGVGIASASELSFNWLCFGAAMGSNLGSASRSVYSKKVMGKGSIGENMDSANVYAVLTIMATFMLIPISLAIEGPSGMIKGFKVAYAAGGIGFLKQMVFSGFYYYMYNEVAFLALGKLDPVSHAVTNTMKRVVVIADMGHKLLGLANGDVDGDKCADYTDGSFCGTYYDDDDFKSMSMCCVCGGGSTGTDLGTCEDLDSGTNGDKAGEATGPVAGDNADPSDESQYE